MTEDEPSLETRIEHQRLAAKATVGFFFVTCLVVALISVGKLEGEVLDPLPPSLIAVAVVGLLAFISATRLGRRAARKNAAKRPNAEPALRDIEARTTIQIVGAATVTAGAHLQMLTAMGTGRWLPWIFGVVLALAVLRYLRPPTAA